MSEDGVYEVAVVGGGPVGCATALAFAARGARVLVLEANARAAERLAGEWLHPAAAEALAALGVELRTDAYPNGKGFVVLPDDGSEPIVLPYAEGRSGVSLPHHKLVAELRRKLARDRAIEYREPARVTAIDGDRIAWKSSGGAVRSLHAQRIVGATGRSGALQRAFGVDARATACSRMVGVVLRDAELPFEGYGHLCLGAPGPILVYRISASEIRVCLDVPLAFDDQGERSAALYDAYAPALPRALLAAFRRALANNELSFANNQTKNRGYYGREGCALVGDAVGYHHPLTAVGLTLGFADGVALARAPSFAAYRRERDRASRVPETLAIALYEIFTGASEETREARRAVYALFRGSEFERRRTMALLGCDDTSFLHFGSSFTRVLGIATRGLAAEGVRRGRYRHALDLARGLGARAKDWLAEGTLHIRAAEPTHTGNGYAPPSTLARFPNADGDARARGPHARRKTAVPDTTGSALALGARALLAQQDDDGSWEGEVIWCALLAAEYVLAFHIMNVPLTDTRKKRLLLQFERTRLPSGLWGLAQLGEPSLFVTTLVYVAARVLGLPADAALLAPARELFAREGSVEAIPTWGKFWLALLSLYEWKGVNPVVPELWSMPSTFPLHPGRYYCHTRLIYLAMATLYAERFQLGHTPLTHQLRSELYPRGFENVNFARARNVLRKADLFAPPSALLRGAYETLRALDRVRSRKARAPLLSELRRAIRWELAASSYTSISPVSGLLNILALWVENPDDPDVKRAISHFDCWVWEDDRDGARVAGARTAIWDTSFALQTLARCGTGAKIDAAIERADQFLSAQQIRHSFTGYAENHRLDPRGGYTLSWGWHSWAVSDCTAEAIFARLEAGVGAGPSDEDVALAADFILRTQGPAGGFGSYEEPRVPFSLEWLNPAEMFGDSMTESGYVECTASCVAALARIAQERPQLLQRPELAGIPRAIERGVGHIRRQQRADGAWEGAWGVRFIYGTWFGVRGLLAGGIAPTDAAIRGACEWLKAHQREDGSWGERHSPHAPDYVAHDEGQIVQTAWALLALLEAREPDFSVLERAAGFLARAQLGNGEWPRQDPVGLFFRTARLEYTLYRCYFPLWSLALFQERRLERAPLLADARVAMTAS